jgi:hypothetical protein
MAVPHDVTQLPHRREFDATWLLIPAPERAAIEAEINRRLDDLIHSPDPNWGSITNTSIEGGKTNPGTGIRGDWTGTVFQPIYETACGTEENRAGMFYGNVWRKVIIERPELWVGIRSAPTFPQRGITLGGKSHFLDRGLRVCWESPLSGLGHELGCPAGCGEKDGRLRYAIAVHSVVSRIALLGPTKTVRCLARRGSR